MVALTPMAVSKERTSCTNRGLVRKEPSENLKRGPSCAPHRDRNGTVAATGHRSCPVAPITIVTPAQKGSVFEALIVINIFDGAVRLSKEISPKVKCSEVSKLELVGQQISPDRRNPKKQTFIAAQSIRRSQVHGRVNK